MAKNWQDVKNAIEKEIDVIWFDEPKELTLSKKGIFPSGAGTDGQAFGNLLFLFADTHALGNLVFSPPMYYTLKDPSFSLDNCKTLFTQTCFNKCRILGMSSGPGTKCPAAWLNLPKFHQFCTDIIDSYDSIKTKEEFTDLLWSWFNYVDRMNKWTYIIFPWEVAGLYYRAINENIPEDMMKLVKETGIM